jgi:hypothetical protein
VSADSDLLSSRLSPEDEEKLTSEQRHADLLERVIKFGLNQSQHLIEVQVDIYCILLQDKFEHQEMVESLTKNNIKYVSWCIILKENKIMMII